MNNRHKAIRQKLEMDLQREGVERIARYNLCIRIVYFFLFMREQIYYIFSVWAAINNLQYD